MPRTPSLGRSLQIAIGGRGAAGGNYGERPGRPETDKSCAAKRRPQWVCSFAVRGAPPRRTLERSATPLLELSGVAAQRLGRPRSGCVRPRPLLVSREAGISRRDRNRRDHRRDSGDDLSRRTFDRPHRASGRILSELLGRQHPDLTTRQPLAGTRLLRDPRDPQPPRHHRARRRHSRHLQPRRESDRRTTGRLHIQLKPSTR